MLEHLVAEGPAQGDRPERTRNHGELRLAPEQRGVADGRLDKFERGGRQRQCRRCRDEIADRGAHSDGPSQQDDDEPVPEIKRIGDSPEKYGNTPAQEPKNQPGRPASEQSEQSGSSQHRRECPWIGKSLGAREREPYDYQQ